MSRSRQARFRRGSPRRGDSDRAARRGKVHRPADAKSRPPASSPKESALREAWRDRFALRAGVLTAFLLLVSALTFDPKLYINGDNVTYIRLAERLLNEGVLWGSRKFPPFFPMMLAPVQLLFGTAWLPQKILVCLLYGVSGALLLRLSERLLPRGWAFLAVAAALIVIPVLEFSHYVMSEIPFLLLSLLALIAGERALRPSVAGGDQRRAGPLLLFFLFSALAFYTRSVGAALPAALLLIAFCGRRWRLLAASVGLLLLLLVPWIIHTYFSGLEGHTYLQQIICINPYYPAMGKVNASWLLSRLQQNAETYFLIEIPWVVFPFDYRSTYTPQAVAVTTNLPLLAALLIDGLIVLGIVRALRRAPLTATYGFVSVLVALAWPPIWASMRFVLPIVPLMVLFFLVGFVELIGSVTALLRRLLRRPMTPRLLPTLLSVLLVVLLALGLRNTYRYAQETRDYPDNWALYFKGAEWARDNLPAGSMVIDRKPGMFHLVSGLPARGFPREYDPEKMLDYLRAHKARYLHAPTIPYDDMTRILYPFLAARDTYFDVVWAERLSDNAWGLMMEFFPEGGRPGFEISWTREADER